MDLFTPAELGPFHLKNRCVMAPMARARSGENRAPGPLVAEYYAQRAGAGLIVTEASSVSPMSVSRPHASAIYNAEHVAGWRLVAERVHQAGGLIFQQIYHLGRKSDPSRMPGLVAPVSASAIAARGQVAGLHGTVDFAVPRALETHEIAGVVEEFRAGAANAKEAGMDGIEIHAANCYLIDQFLRDGANHRADSYGGSVANRMRLMLEIVDAVCTVFTPDRVGVRFSPHAVSDGTNDSDPAALFGHAAAMLRERGIGYLHLIEAARPGTPNSPPEGSTPIMRVMREHFDGMLIVNGGYDKTSGNAAIASGLADLVAFGALFIANPDLPERLRRNAPFNPPDTAHFHIGGAEGYADYPVLEPA